MRQARAFFFVCAGLLNLALLGPRPVAAAWPTDPLVNVPLCTYTGRQTVPVIVSDGAGGCIVAWGDYRLNNGDIYAQRVSADGTVQWPDGGVAVSTANHDQVNPTLTSDGAGGAIVTWLDSRSGYWDIYAQRVSGAGAVQWAADGVALCTAAGSQGSPTITSDGAGGAIVTWQDARATLINIYAQRVSADGTVQWPTDGVLLYKCGSWQLAPTITADGAGGAIVVWKDDFSGWYDLYAQRVSAAGAIQWGNCGVSVCAAAYIQDNPTLTSDGAGGAIVAWEDYRSGACHIYAQRVSAAGTALWTGDGVALCTAAGSQSSPRIISDGAGGAIVTWQGSGIYAQRVKADGTVQWPTDGVALCTLGGSSPTIASDGAGGAIVTWSDGRSGNSDVYAQRVSPAGVVQWASDGVPVCTARRDQASPTLTPDGAGGAIVTWWDSRVSPPPGVYAQRVKADGTLGGSSPTPVLLSFVNAEVGEGGINLTWYAGVSMSTRAAVYRSSGGVPWTRIGEVASDGVGYLRYTDRLDAAATRVGYRLGIVDAGVENFYGETWVELPAPAFALDPVRPNPSRDGTLTIRFALPNAAPASLRLYDVSGRLIASREVGALGAGHHAVDLDEGQRLGPGLYFAQLTQGANVRTTRVAVLE